MACRIENLRIASRLGIPRRWRPGYWQPRSPEQVASAQTYGFATLPPGTLNHTTASAIAKVLKEKANINMLVQPTAGDTVIIPDGRPRRGRDRHLQCRWKCTTASAAGQKDLRIIATAHALRTPFFVRKDSADEVDRRPQGQARDRWAIRPCATSTRVAAPCWRAPA